MDEIVCVTGAEGFIGSHLVELLVSRGKKVRAISQYNSFGTRGWLDHLEKDVLDSVQFFDSDIRDPDQVESFVSGSDVVVHLAALIGIPYSYVAPSSYVDTNINGTLNVLNASRRAGVSRVIHTSTSEVYGTAQTVPISETHPLNAQSPYAATKVAADQLAHSYWASFELPVVTLRPFNVFGPRQSTRAVIPTIITQLIKGTGTISIGNLHSTRDMNFVKDTVRAFDIAISAPDAVGRTFNIGTGHEVSIEELAKQIGKILGKDVEFEVDENRKRPDKSEVERLVSDSRLAGDVLGWRLNHSPEASLIKGLEESVKWFSNPKNIQHYRRVEYAI